MTDTDTPAVEDAAAIGAEEPGDSPTPQHDPAADDGKQKSNVQDRIDELTRKRREAEREADYWRGVAQGGASQPSQTPTATPEPKPSAADALDPDDFDSMADYNKAYRKALTTELMEEQQKRDAAKADAQKKLEIAGHYAKGREKYEDFQQVALNPSTPITQVMFDAAMGKALPDVLYFLGSNREESARIAQLPVNEQIKEIGKIELKLTTQKPKPTVTNAPSPQETRVKSGSSPGELTEDKMTRAERFEKWEKERIRRIKEGK